MSQRTVTIPMDRSGGIARGRVFFTRELEIEDSPPGANCITIRVTSERGGHPVTLDMDATEAMALAYALGTAAANQRTGA